MSQYLVPQEELEKIASENGVALRDICRACGQVIRVAIFRGSGACSDQHRKVINGDDPSPYPFRGSPATGAP